MYDKTVGVPEFDPKKIEKSCPTNYTVLSSSLHSVKLSTDSGHLCNNTSIAKILIFNNDFTFTVSIRGVNTDHASLSIKDTFGSTCQEIASVFEIVDKIQLCQGISLDGLKYVRKNHITEELLKINDEKAVRVLRSTKCKMVSAFVGRQRPNCRTCQTMTVHYESDLEDSNSTALNTEESVQNTEESIRKLMQNVTEELLTLIISQVKNSANSHQNRWNQRIISECLNLYTPSPEGYRVLRQSGLLILPSPRLLILYKNSINHIPGFDSNIFNWMNLEAKRLHIPPEGRIGGLLIDEMAIQESIEIVKWVITLSLLD